MATEVNPGVKINGNDTEKGKKEGKDVHLDDLLDQKTEHARTDQQTTEVQALLNDLPVEVDTSAGEYKPWAYIPIFGCPFLVLSE